MTTEWRLGRAALGLRLLPVLACTLAGVWALRSRLTGSGDAVAYTFLTVDALLLAVVLLALVVRTRVRLLATGVEIRELRTRTYAWADIDWVAPTPRHRGVRLGFRDGSARTLPAPRRVASGVTDQGADREIDGAVVLLRRWAAERG
jgi:hypothetical protein